MLVVDDEPAVIALFEHVFAGTEIQVESASTGESALESIRSNVPDSLVLDVILPDVDGLELFGEIKKIAPRLPVIIMTGGRESQTAIEAMQLGALDYLVKPLDVRALNKVVRRALEVRRLMVEPVELQTDEQPPASASAMIGCCEPMQEVYKAIGRVASQNISVLIRGESGTGKELVARAIYQNGPRKNKPFLAINCAAIPESLLESELFGHEKGSFTGADKRRIGTIEQCDGGTLFLDEIGDMDAPLQSKLLRVLQEKQFQRVGGNETLEADVRILAATHRNIEKMCAKGTFREDLFYRLNGYTIKLPPLRERLGDIELLIEFFRQTANEELGKNITRIDSKTIERLKTYHWPGNVRQLQNVIHQAVLQSNGPVLLVDFLPELTNTVTGTAVETVKVPIAADVQSANSQNQHKPATAKDSDPNTTTDSDTHSESASETIASMLARRRETRSPTLYDDVIEEVERQLIAVVLEESDGNQTEAAKRLGISRTTLRTKIDKLRIGIRRVVE